MKQIKTIAKRLNNSAEFDADVNAALQEGWTLIERKVLQPPSQPSDGVYLHNMLYAELERFTEPDECEDSPLCNLVENCARFIGKLADKQMEKAPDLPEDAEKPKEDAPDYIPTASCYNCKHIDRRVEDPPCCDCHVLRHWEPRT